MQNMEGEIYCPLSTVRQSYNKGMVTVIPDSSKFDLGILPLEFYITWWSQKKNQFQAKFVFNFLYLWDTVIIKINVWQDPGMELPAKQSFKTYRSFIMDL